ncbi:hypothetical protein SY27_02400 [Flavobacterium sp. 316]|nr:hypothetical protein SY27_02400 [Flavobacterium sp. 316]
MSFKKIGFGLMYFIILGKSSSIFGLNGTILSFFYLACCTKIMLFFESIFNIFNVNNSPDATFENEKVRFVYTQTGLLNILFLVFYK